MPPGAACPGDDLIERLAAGDAPPAGVATHLEDCEACRLRLHAAREEVRFITRVRTLAAGTLAPEGSPRIPGYRTSGVLSIGSQGVVYRAVQESTSRTVAIKTLLAGESASPRQRARAEREAEIAARLRHPNIVTVFESRPLSDGRIAVVMEFIDGVPIDKWIAPGDTADQRQRALLRVFIEVCNAIHHAHLNAVIHRDLKPDNILVTPEARPVVLDFGIAKAGGLQTTLTGEFAGTPAYASPEQVRGNPNEVDALTDVYSLGVVLYRLLCGRLPYDLPGSLLEIARIIAEVEPTRPRIANPLLAPDLEAIVLRAMAKDKERRYHSAAELARDLERYLAGHPVEARGGSGWYLLRKAVAVNRRRLILAGGVALMFIAAGAAVIASQLNAAASAKRAAEQAAQARAERVRARAVTELLREALPDSDPAHPEIEQAVGAGLSRLYFRLETGAFADDPELDLALRRMWGGVYTGFGAGKAANRVEYAEVSLRGGLERLRREHKGAHAETADTLHDLAAVLLVRGRAPEAEPFCREALSMRRVLVGTGSFATAESRALLARILVAIGRPDEAMGEAQAALAVFGSLPETTADLPIASMSALKARLALDRNDGPSAERSARDALLRRIRRLPPEDPDLHASLRDAADFADRFPRTDFASLLAACWAPRPPAEGIRADLPILSSPDRGDTNIAIHTGRTEAIGRLVRLQESLLSETDPAIVRLLISQLRAAEGEHLQEQKIAAALRAADLLSRARGPSDPGVVVCLEEAAIVSALAGQADRAVDLGQRVCAIRDEWPIASRDPLMTANSRRLLAWYCTLDRRFDEAAPLWRRAIDEFRGVVGPDHYIVALCESGLALCLLESGKTDEADTLSARAFRIAKESTRAGDQLANISFVRGHVLSRLGRSDQAREALGLAWSEWYHLCSPRFAWRRLLVADMAQVCETAGDHAAAAAWLARNDERETPAP